MTRTQPVWLVAGLLLCGGISQEPCQAQLVFGGGAPRVVVNRIVETDDTISLTTTTEFPARNFGSLPGNIAERNIAAEVPQPPHSLELWGWGSGWGSGWAVGPWWNYGNRWNIAPWGGARPWGWGPRWGAWGPSPFAFRYFNYLSSQGYAGLPTYGLYGPGYGFGTGYFGAGYAPLGYGVVSEPIVTEYADGPFQLRPYAAGYRGCFYW